MWNLQDGYEHPGCKERDLKYSNAQRKPGRKDCHRRNAERIWSDHIWTKQLKRGTMVRRFKAAAVQMNTKTDKMENLAGAEYYIDEAAAGGASLICFPENMNLDGRNTGEGGNAETVSGITVSMLIRKAKEYGVYIHSGSFRETIPDQKKYYNTSVLISPQGEILARYHKMHLFDGILPDGTEIRETAKLLHGKEIVTADTELGVIGFSICYDVRFPELYRLLAQKGAQIICVPAEFGEATGPAHWESLVRARAIENGCYIIAPDQCGPKKSYPAYGHSMIVSPWGEILAQAGREPAIIYAQIDLDYLEEVRKKRPVLANRREDVYSLKEL